MKSKSQEFVALVQSNKMADAKKVFDHLMKAKMVQQVSDMRKQVAETLFNKK